MTKAEKDVKYLNTNTMNEKIQLLKKYYGYSSFRPGQEEIIDATLDGKDSVVLMPTGGGKSLCYQIPALMLPGCAIVVSPLIALMNDQVLALQANGIAAAAIHSNRDERLNRETYEMLRTGRIKIIYVSPERLLIDIKWISEICKISFIAIDEAHCISQWGHDFRPVYTSLGTIKTTFPGIPVMALTATADRLTRLDIATALNLDNPFCWTGSFDRPNISLCVMDDPGKKKRIGIISSLIDKYHMDAGIVYCLSRKKTEMMNEALLDAGYRSVCYHAGLPAGEREEAQRKFLNGEVQVVCATIAFGMGIDKSNIRWVVHNNIPGNIESYYQEIGRAGRDGMPAEAVLFYNYSDVVTRKSFVEESGQVDINREKLDFMQRYAESTICRRRILLSYFSEHRNCDCGNCDNCRSPRRRIDGTVLAQKAVSAAIRCGCNEGMGMIIDILRASSRAEIIEKGYHRLRTYGAGHDLTYREWQSYLLQMIQLGVFEIAYEDHFHLRPTQFGMSVVKGFERIVLSEYEPGQHFISQRANERAYERDTRTSEQKLLDTLKKVRLELAQKENIPVHTILSDATLADIVKRLPTDFEEFSQVMGVGEIKMAKYGKNFILPVRKHKGLKATMPTGSSTHATLILLNSGKSPEEIAEIRGIAIGTVYSHLAALADQDKFSDFRRVVSMEDFNTVAAFLATEPEKPTAQLEEQQGLPGYLVRIVKSELDWNERHAGDEALDYKTQSYKNR